MGHGGNAKRYRNDPRWLLKGVPGLSPSHASKYVIAAKVMQAKFTLQRLKKGPGRLLVPPSPKCPNSPSHSLNLTLSHSHLDPRRWFPVSLSSSMVCTLSTRNLAVGPSGALD